MSFSTCSHAPERLFSGSSPTVRPKQMFLSREDAEDLYKALHASKTDTETIVNILANRSFIQRVEISIEYNRLHKAILLDDLKKKLSGDLEKIIVAMMLPRGEYYAEELHRAVAGLGTDESDLIEVLCTLGNGEIKEIRRAYNYKYEVHLEEDIKDDTSGKFKELLVSLVRTERDEITPPNRDQAKADALKLYKVKKDERWPVFSNILIHRGFPQLRLIFEEYEKLSNKDFETVVKDDFCGDVEEGLLAIVETVKNKSRFFAKKLNKSIAGLGTKDRDLIRVIVMRSEIDMADIKREYEENYKESLKKAIIGDTSGDYKKCLLTLIGEA